MRLALACAAFALALITQSFSFQAQLPTQPQSGGKKMGSQLSRTSERERYGLRGLVKSCLEERSDPETPNTPAGVNRKYSYKTEYDLEGRQIEMHSYNSDGSEWVNRNVYDDSGRLLKTISGNKGAPSAETVYSYDNHAKLVRITKNGSPDNPIAFRYDEAGRKTKVQISRAADYRPNVGFVPGSEFDAVEAPPTLPGGGTTTTIYDDLDRPVEVQTRDSQGELVSRSLRTYDEQGRVLDEKQVLPTPETLIPAEMRSKILEESGASTEQLREHLTKLMGGQAGPTSMHYTYGKDGQKSKLFAESSMKKKRSTRPTTSTAIKRRRLHGQSWWAAIQKMALHPLDCLTPRCAIRTTTIRTATGLVRQSRIETVRMEPFNLRRRPDGRSTTTSVGQLATHL